MYEYKHVECSIGFFSDENHRQIIDEHAKQGWRFVQIVVLHYSQNRTAKKLEIIFERNLG